jgi:hypothetical protein
MCGSIKGGDGGLMVFILKRKGDGEAKEDNWTGQDIVLAHCESEAYEIAEAHYPVKREDYVEVEVIGLDRPAFIGGCCLS